MADLKSMENYLREYTLVKVRIDGLKEELDDLLTTIGDIENTLSGMSGNKTDNRLSDGAERLFSELLVEINEITDRYKRVGVMIGGMENPEMKAVFACRYLEQLAFWKIAKKLDMSETKVKTLHKSGLMILKERYG